MRSLSMVFSKNIAHVALAATVAVLFWVVMAYFDQLLFFSPMLAFSVPPSGWPGFLLSTVTAILLGIVISMNVYIFRTSAVKIGPSLISGSALGVVSSACAGCTSAGFFMIGTFGVAGATATSLFAQYQLLLRLVSIGLLAWAMYSANKRITQNCMIKPKNNMEER